MEIPLLVRFSAFCLTQLKTLPQIYFNSKFHKLKLKLKVETDQIQLFLVKIKG